MFHKISPAALLALNAALPPMQVRDLHPWASAPGEWSIWLEDTMFQRLNALTHKTETLSDMIERTCPAPALPRSLERRS